MNPLGVNAWVWVSPPTAKAIADMAPQVKAMGFELPKLGVAGPLYTPVGKTWQMDEAERIRIIDQLVEGLRPLADDAGKRGIRLEIEPLIRFETSFLNINAQPMAESLL
jgi:D-psicose/D-tagatose/L-ribulose 3-epimerase